MVYCFLRTKTKTDMQAETKIQTEKKVHTKRQQVDRYTGRQAGGEGEGERETQTDRQRDGERETYTLILVVHIGSSVKRYCHAMHMNR